MMTLTQDILLDDNAFKTASADMKALKTRTEELKTELIDMYKLLKNAMQTPAGAAADLVTMTLLITPINDMALVIDHISATLTEISGSGYYKKVFDKFEELNSSVNF